MENYLSYILTAIASFVVAFGLKYVGPRSRLVWWSPHSFTFDVPMSSPEGQPMPPIILTSHSIAIQNLGTAPTKYIEIVHKTKPDLFRLQPALDYTETETPQGEHVIRIPFLAPKEFFHLEFLTYKHFADLLYIRSEWGLSNPIPVQPSRVMPRWTILILYFFILIGIISSCFAFVKITLFLWPKIFN